MTIANPSESKASTAGERAFELLEAHFYSGNVTWAEIEEEVRSLATNCGFGSEWEAPAPPEPEKIRVGTFVYASEGSDIEFYASCDTLVYMDENDRLVFEGQDSDGGAASCVLSIDMLLERARGLRAQFDERVKS